MNVKTLTAPAHAPVRIDVPFADCCISTEAQDAALRVLRSGWVTTGREVLAFEDEFAAAVGARQAVAVSSCTAAIELSLRSLGLPAGSRVLTSTNTFCGAVQAIMHAGLQPVLVDVDELTGMPTPETVRAAVWQCGRPAAMTVVHWAGDPADVVALAAAAGLSLDRIVEDGAHAIGSSLGGLPVGSTSAATCFSFYATKNLPLGEGGMITTEDVHRAAWLRRARLHGMSADAWRRYLPGGGWRYDVAEAGLKANMTDVQGAMGRAQLTHLEAWQRRRSEIAERYDECLAALAADRLVGLPHRPEPGRGTHAWHLYAARVQLGSRLSRDDVIAGLSARGVGTSVHFIPVHRLAYFRQAAAFPARGLPGADALFEQLVSLPIYPRLSNDQVDAVCAALADVVKPKTSREGRA
jgi:dTDP-4-amino-4,6-dideoxygalactose transaminase